MAGNRSLCLVILLAALASSGSAEATVVPSDVVLAGGQRFTASRDLMFVGPGAHRITTTDLHWLDSPLSALSFRRFPAATPITTLIGRPGTLAFFRGRFSLHRVPPVVGGTPRMNSVLTYSVEPGHMLSAMAQRMYYGRTA